jgi:hypothetical protein
MPATEAKKSTRYEVKSQGGQLFYDTFIHVEQAYLAGLIDPADEIRKEGDAEWKRASAMPQLRNLQHAEKRIAGAYVPWIIGAVVLGIAALIFLMQGKWLIGLVLAVILSTVLFRLTYKSATDKLHRLNGVLEIFDRVGGI